MDQSKGMGIHEFRISGLNCIDCAAKIEDAITRIEGVKDAKVNFATSLLRVAHEGGTTCTESCLMEKEIEKEIRRIGFGLEKGGIETVTLRTRHIISELEISKIKRTILSLKGSKKLDVLGSNIIKIEYNPRILQPAEIKRALKEIRVNVTDVKEGITKRPLLRGEANLIMVIVSGLFIGGGIGLSFFGRSFKGLTPDFGLIYGLKDASSILYLMAMISSGYYVARRGLLAVKDRHLDINFLMCIAVIGAACIGEWLEGATVIFLFSLAQLLEAYTLDKSRNAIRALMEISPKEALVKRPYGEERIMVDDVKVGDIIIVRPGERISLDGKVVKGYSTINQSPITGESIPIEKVEGDEVYAGTINGEGSLEVEVIHLSRDSTLAGIIHLIEDAQAQKAPFQNFVDRFARYYTPAVIFLAIFVALIPPLFFHSAFIPWFYRSLVLLVISCPCALVISTPVSLISGITCAAKRGILFKGGAYLEQLGGLNVIAFDKTGTLTYGSLEVTDIIPINIKDGDELLALAASIEARSEHSLAGAILMKAREKGLNIIEGDNFQSFPSKGAVMEIKGLRYYIGNAKFIKEIGFSIPEPDSITTSLTGGSNLNSLTHNIEKILMELQDEGKTTLLLARDKCILGIIAVADKLKETSTQTIKELYNEGIKKIVVISGDHVRTTMAICRKLDIDEFIPELSPEGKVMAIKRLIRDHGKTGMVGDGINDAPALSTATVGMAMGSTGIDITLESADITIMGDDLSKLPIAIRLSKRTIRVIKQNIFLSIFIKGIFLLLALPGLATLWMAVGADMGASLLVIINGLRLLRIGPIQGYKNGVMR